MPAQDIVPDMFAAQTPLNCTAGQVIKVIIYNPDGSQLAVAAEYRVPDGKALAGGFSVGGMINDEE